MSGISRNIAKCLAKLDARTAGFEMGTGGEPGQGNTPQVIAGALGAVAAKGPGPRLALIVLCMRWWPSMAFGPDLIVQRRMVDKDGTPGFENVHVDRTLGIDRDSGEGSPFRRPDAPFSVRTTVLRPRVVIESRIGNTTAAGAQAVQTMRRWIDRKLAAGAWPLPADLQAKIDAKPEFWDRLVDAVFVEYRHPGHCRACNGHAQELDLYTEDGRTKSRLIPCKACEGRGLADYAKRRRAHELGIRRTDYDNHLDRPYVWLLNLLRYLEYTAARSVNRALDEGSIRTP